MAPVKRPIAAAFAAPRRTQAAEEQTPLTDKDVYGMVKAKVAPEVIVAKIEASRCHFDTSPSILAEMRHAGVPNDVLMAMVKAPYGRVANVYRRLLTTRCRVG